MSLRPRRTDTKEGQLEHFKTVRTKVGLSASVAKMKSKNGCSDSCNQSTQRSDTRVGVSHPRTSLFGLRPILVCILRLLLHTIFMPLIREPGVMRFSDVRVISRLPQTLQSPFY